MPCHVFVSGSPYFSYFAAYEVTKKFLTPAGASPSDLNLQAVILAGGTAGVAMWAIAIPPDVSSQVPPSPRK
jgi:solute carrier family 25 carnitine/acylcarnitine transporter 20/29